MKTKKNVDKNNVQKVVMLAHFKILGSSFAVCVPGLFKEISLNIKSYL